MDGCSGTIRMDMQQIQSFCDMLLARIDKIYDEKDAWLDEMIARNKEGIASALGKLAALPKQSEQLQCLACTGKISKATPAQHTSTRACSTNRTETQAPEGPSRLHRHERAPFSSLARR